MTRTYYRRNPETGAVETSPVPFSALDARAPVYTDRYMEGAHTADGVDISSRSKRRDYMRATGSADASDYTNAVARGAAERERLRAGDHDDTAISRAVDQAMRGLK